MDKSRFSTALVMLLLVIMVFKFVTDPFAPENIIPPLLESVRILAISLGLGLVFYAIVRLFKGSNEAPDFQKFVFSTTAILIVLFIIYHVG